MSGFILAVMLRMKRSKANANVGVLRARRLNTVRAKLMMLVALSALAAGAALPIVSWSMHRQLVGEAADRVPQAVKGFEVELEDDVHDLTSAAHNLANSERLRRAAQSGDVAGANAILASFADVYPDIAFMVFDVQGRLVTQRDCAAPAKTWDELGLPRLGPDDELELATAHGCETRTDAPPALVMAHGMAGAGFIVTCLPFDAAELDNARVKLGVELALLGPQGEISATQGFPENTATAAKLKPSVLEHDGRLFAIARVEPKTKVAPYAFAVALDVSAARGIVRQNLAIAAAIVLLAALLATLVGARMASLMSRALMRVHAALRKLEQQEYAKVELVRTGDELEDLATGFNAMVDGLKERDKLRTTFGKYMTQSVMEHLLAGKVQLGGETLTVTILFSDIRSFTSISEKMDAHALVALLNEYFTEMVSIVIQEDGVVDKYIGDAIMAVFGAPVTKPDDALRAVRAAVRMRTALGRLNERLGSRGMAPLKTGIGLHTGQVVAGNIGSEQRMEYTVIGDAVNLASRLEGQTKELGCDVLVSEDTYALVKDHVDAKPVKEVTVKGRAQPVMTFALLGLVTGERVSRAG